MDFILYVIVHLLIVNYLKSAPSNPSFFFSESQLSMLVLEEEEVAVLEWGVLAAAVVVVAAVVDIVNLAAVDPGMPVYSCFLKAYVVIYLKLCLILYFSQRGKRFCSDFPYSETSQLLDNFSPVFEYISLHRCTYRWGILHMVLLNYSG